MKNGINVSGRMYAISLILLLFVGVNALFNYLLLRNIEDDARLINYTGIMRGTIQRVAKLETNNIKSDSLIQEVDKIMISNLVRNRLDLFGTWPSYFKAIDELKKSWASVKNDINLYRATQDQATKDTLVQQSEQVWNFANGVVFQAQLLSERKVGYFGLLLVLTLFNVFLVILIIYIIKRLVKDKLEYLANFDILTGVLNRTAFCEYIRREISSAQRHKTPMCVIIYDIDYFKKVNDTFGHDKGDYVLKQLSKLVSKLIRSNDILARIGGEEFVIILPQTDINDANNMAETIRKAVEEHKFDNIGSITISLGISQYKNKESRDSLMGRADEALYRAKAAGRNRVCLSE